jgi:UDP-N-acetylglucosamine:LPS N-acetylglucosamine transferase
MRAHAVSFLNSEALQDVISRSSLVVARSGYSTIMDLLALRKNAIVVPTPGQTEQEYLADRWSKRGVLQAMTQNDFDLHKAMKKSNCFTGFRNIFRDPELFERELDRVLTAKGSSTFAK